MKTFGSLLLLATLFLLPSLLQSGDSIDPAGIRSVGHVKALTQGRHGYVIDEILVKYRPHVSQRRQGEQVAALRGQTLRRLERLNMHRIKLPAGVTVEAALEKLRMQDDVEKAEPNYVRSVSLVPDDTNFNQLWAFRNTGQSVNGTWGTSGADISLPMAWDLNTGSGNVLVAVIDSGVYHPHPELAPNIWSNTGESCVGGSDADHNGFVGDCRGWDFVDDDNDPMDLNGHGTHVAGIIGAVGANHSGTVGVNWAVRIMPLRVLDSTGNGTTADVIDAIEYATRMGAQVINASFGGEDPSQLERDAIQAFTAGGGVFVAAAGNGGANNDSAPFYPASYSIEGLIAVAATDSRDALASWSNHGANSVLVAAPGVNILSTYTPTRITAYYDGFGVLGWTTGGAHNSWGVEAGGLSDSPGQSYLPGTNSWAMSPLVNLAGTTGCRLSYQLNTNLVQNQDFLYTETSSDGASWALKGQVTGIAGTRQVTHDLGSYNGGNLYVRFHLITDANSSGRDGINIDNVTVSCFPNPPVGSEFAYMSGTSMAAPMVSGLAALIKSTSPSLTNLQITEIIGDSADRKGWLAGKVRSGGRINANRAVNAATLRWPSLSATTGSGAVALAWSGGSGPITGYIVERAGTSGGPYSAIASLSADQATYSDSGAPGAAMAAVYYYRVRASNGISESLPSNEVSAAVSTGSSGDGGGGGGGGGGCFIATAAFGSYLDPEVKVLRRFRDDHLLTNRIGRWFVALYYRNSPPFADTIREYPALRLVTRTTLAPLVYGMKYPTVALALVVVGLGSTALLVRYRRRLVI